MVSREDCWEWPKPGKRGYTPVYYRKDNTSVHRIMYQLYNKTIIHADTWVLHKCDNPRCVNPEHLFGGSNIDNINDKVAKGRQVKGEDVQWSKLKEGEVLEILESPLTGKHFAEKFNVSKGTIYAIRRGDTWAHIKCSERAEALRKERAERHRGPKISDDQVRFIRSTDMTTQELATKYGVTRTCIIFIRNYTNRKNVK